MKMSFDMYTHWLKRWHCFINWKPQRHGTLFKTVPRAVDWVKSKQIYVWHGAIAQTEDNCTKWNSIITCKTTIATMTLPRLLLVHKHIPTMMLGSLLLWYTFFFSLCPQIYRHCYFVCVFAHWVFNTMQTNIFIATVWFGLSRAASLSFSFVLQLSFQRHIIEKSECPKRARDARISHSIELNEHIFLHIRAMFSIVRTVVCEIHAKSTAIATAKSDVDDDDDDDDGWRLSWHTKICCIHFTQNSWWDLEPDHYNAD